jgi:hypothetical protein
MDAAADYSHIVGERIFFTFDDFPVYQIYAILFRGPIRAGLCCIFCVLHEPRMEECVKMKEMPCPVVYMTACKTFLQWPCHVRMARS